MKNQVLIELQTITDSKITEGLNLQHHLVGLIQGGITLRVDMGGNVCRNFSDVQDFTDWFNSL